VDWRRLLTEAPRHVETLERFARRVAELAS
jgi:hypothetical protein